jgi:hypothetical protein
MKRKKLKKLVNLIVHEMEHMRHEPIKMSEPIDWSPYDEEVSEKFNKIYRNLLSWGQNLRIEISNDHKRIALSTDDITSIKRNRKSNQPSKEDDYLRVEIMKDEGFAINKGWRGNFYYTDTKIFDELYQLTIDTKKKINREEFDNVFEQVMLESGMARDNNLQELFSK